jgi:hypothetical protein
MNGGESAEAEETDRLLLSSLRYWEIERDLIEERLAARGAERSIAKKHPQLRAGPCRP